MNRTTEISRDPSDYRPRNHDLQRAKYRGIDLELVSETIEQGSVFDSYKPNCKIFKQNFVHTDHPVRVVVNHESQHVITVAWEYEDK